MALRLLLAAPLLIFSGLTALACPVCDTGTGQAVRAGLFDDGDFGVNLLAVLLPFPLFLGIAAALYYGPPARRPHRDKEPPSYDRS